MINQNRRNLRGSGRQEPQLSIENVSVEPGGNIKQQITLSNDEYILQEYNLQLQRDGENPVLILPSRTTDGYKLSLLNASRRKRGLGFLPVLPDDVSPNPRRNRSFADDDDRSLINRKNQLTEELSSDLNNQQIRNEIADINNEQKVRAQLLAEQIQNNNQLPASIIKRIDEINTQIDEYKNILDTTPSGQQRRDITAELKNLEEEVKLLQDPIGQLNKYKKQTEELNQALESEQQPTGPAEATPVPLDDEPKETSFDASNPDTTTNVPPSTGTSTLGELFGDLRDTITSNTRPPSISSSDVPPPRQPEDSPEPDTSTTADLEDTTEHHDITESDTIKDNTLDFEHLGASRTNFDNNFIGFILSTVLKRSLIQGGVGQNQADILVHTAKGGIGMLYNNFKTKRLQNDYNRLTIDQPKVSIDQSKSEGGKRSTPMGLSRATIPLVIITLYLYLVDKETDFKIGINFITRPIIKYILSSVLSFEDQDIDYALLVLESIPTELKTAYMKQKGRLPVALTIQEISSIGLFVDKVNKEYFKKYKTELKKDLFDYENKQSLYLYEMLETLNSSSVLFQISSAFNTLGELISEIKANPYLLVQLFALLYNEIEENDLSASNILNQGKVDKLVYYYSNVQGAKKPNYKIDILRDIELDTGKRGKTTPGLEVVENNDKVVLYKYNNRYYVTFRGTDKRDIGDIKLNFQNFGGKDYFNNPEYNQRILLGKQFLDMAIDLSRKEDIEQPIILGYSLGSVSAMTLSQLYPNIETDVYNPVLSKSEITQELMDNLINSNINFNYNEKDPISTNMKFYTLENPGLNIKKYSNNKFFTPHDIRQFS